MDDAVAPPLQLPTPPPTQAAPSPEVRRAQSEDDEVGDEVKDTDDEDDRDNTSDDEGLTVPAKRPRRSKTQLERLAAKGGKAGNPGRFKGMEDVQELLSELLAEYQGLDLRKGSRGKLARLQQFWDLAEGRFWGRFDWQRFKASCKAKDKAGVQDEVNKSLKTWFRDRQDGPNACRANPWAKVLSDLRTSSFQPRKSTAWVRFGQVERDKVRVASGPAATLAERNRVARKLYHEMSASEQAEYRERVEQEHLDALEHHNSVLRGVEPPPPEEQQLARERLSSVVTPLLELIALHTGFTCVSLIGGCYDDVEKRYTVGAVNYGKTTDDIPKDFTSFDPEGYRKRFAGQFALFIGATRGCNTGSSSPEETSDLPIEVILPQPSSSVPPPSQRAAESHLRTTGAPNLHGTAVSPIPPSSSPTRPSPTENERPSLNGSGDEAQFLAWACPELVQRVQKSLSGPERAQQIRLLGEMTDQSERDKLNAAAKVWALSQSLFGSDSSDAHAPVNPVDVVSAPSNTSTPIAQSSAISPHSESVTAAPWGEIQPSSGPPQVRPVAPASSADPRRPKWFTEHHGRFMMEPLEPGEFLIWKECLELWVELEKVNNFSSTKSGLGTSSRPPEIATWIQYARKSRIIVKNRNEFARLWWKWWVKINPPWRKNHEGRPIVGGSGSWACLFRTGINGFLTVFSSLQGLRDATDPSTWHAALLDVRWVLQQLIPAFRASKDKLVDQESSASPNDAVPPPRKKRRIR